MLTSKYIFINKANMIVKKLRGWFDKKNSVENTYTN